MCLYVDLQQNYWHFEENTCLPRYFHVNLQYVHILCSDFLIFRFTRYFNFVAVHTFFYCLFTTVHYVQFSKNPPFQTAHYRLPCYHPINFETLVIATSLLLYLFPLRTQWPFFCSEKFLQRCYSWSACYELIELHHGLCWWKNANEHGSLVSLTFDCGRDPVLKAILKRGKLKKRFVRINLEMKLTENCVAQQWTQIRTLWLPKENGTTISITVFVVIRFFMGNTNVLTIKSPNKIPVEYQKMWKVPFMKRLFRLYRVSSDL